MRVWSHYPGYFNPVICIAQQPHTWVDWQQQGRVRTELSGILASGALNIIVSCCPRLQQNGIPSAYK